MKRLNELHSNLKLYLEILSTATQSKGFYNIQGIP